MSSLAEMMVRPSFDANVKSWDISAAAELECSSLPLDFFFFAFLCLPSFLSNPSSHSCSRCNNSEPVLESLCGLLGMDSLTVHKEY